ncbi:MAG TPA: DUF72 domain-containing protein [Terriglobia bacterium]|nr:DUF72 domain-containing protein [Terriglobia bacterium]
MASKIHIGTSGWHYSHWRGPFYPEDMPDDKMLDYYAQHLQTVEINNSFYRLPSGQTFKSWCDQTPSGFIFAVKASRYITHMKKLKDPESASQKFFAHAEALKKKIGPILFQLPPSWHINVDRLQSFLEALPGGHRYAFEFRDPTWFSAEVTELLKRHDAALCVYDLAGQQSPKDLTARFAYLRLHGPAQQKYSGRYTRPQLQKWLDLSTEWLQHGARQVFVYFDNDQSGYAALNAIELQEMAARAGL